ncbi:hypothetical protein D1AOALGA4SA_6229 [Olavius algarvensis Delta 1 endosymbiont]|nr:hypothetical protein D1AOALGA4SA_6229 [Olavius algarvensis Delta 1 endosymbiont]
MVSYTFSSSSSKLLSRFKTRGRGRVRRRARFKPPVFGVQIYVVSHEHCLWLKDSRSDRIRNFEKANVEYRTSNNECRRNVFYRSY